MFVNQQKEIEFLPSSATFGSIWTTTKEIVLRRPLLPYCSLRRRKGGNIITDKRLQKSSKAAIVPVWNPMQSGLQHKAQCKLRRVSPTLSRVGSPRGRRIDRQDFERARRSSQWGKCRRNSRETDTFEWGGDDGKARRVKYRHHHSSECKCDTLLGNEIENGFWNRLAIWKEFVTVAVP